MDLKSMSARRIAAAIAAKKVSAEEVVEDCVQHLQAINPALNALVAERFDAARQDARRADEMVTQGVALGPLHGVPMTIKDSLDTSDLETCGGTRGRIGHTPERDATAVARLRRAGAILLGKSNTPELTLAGDTINLVHGATRNPYDPRRSPGGSSGGGAALVAAGGPPFDIGSDTRGSLRWPAHCCGVATLKPTWGLVSRAGHMLPPGLGALDRLTHVGPLARKVEDLGLLLELLGGVDPRDPAAIPMPDSVLRPRALSELRIGMCLGNKSLAMDEDTAKVLEEVARSLSSVVHHVEDADLQAYLERGNSLYTQLVSADGGAWMQRRLAMVGTLEQDAHPWLRQRIGNPRLQSAGELTLLLEEIDVLRLDLSLYMERYDLLIGPVFPTPACLPGEWVDFAARGAIAYTELHNLTGWPSAVVRAGTSRGGLPIGVQLTARPWRDADALVVAQFLESSHGGWQMPAL